MGGFGYTFGDGTWEQERGKLRQIIQQLSSLKLGTDASPTFAGFTSARGTFTQAQGTSPFVITSTTVNTNLNADLLDGNHASAFLTSYSETDPVVKALTGIIKSSGTAIGTVTVSSPLDYTTGTLSLTQTSITNLNSALSTGFLKITTGTGLLSADTNTYYKSGDSPTFANITDSGLTITRVPYASTAGLLIDNAALTFDGTTLTSGGYYTSGYAGFGTTVGAIANPVNINYALNASIVSAVNLVTYSTRAAGGTSIYGLGFQAAWQPSTTSSTARTMGYSRGIFGIAGIDTTNVNSAANETVIIADGGLFGVYGIKGGSHTGTATMTNAHGLYVQAPQITGAVIITNNYGLYLESMTAGATLNYSIYSAGGISYHAGNFGIGVIPTVALDVAGAGLFSTTLGITGLTTATGGVTIGASGNIEKLTNDLTITTAASKTIVVSPVVYDELPPTPVTAAKLGSTAPTLATFKGNVEQYTFDATNDYVIGATEVVHWYKEGTNISPHIHWATNGLEVSDKYVKWQLEYTAASMDSTDGVGNAFGNTTTISVELLIPANTADRTHMFTDLTDITGTNIKIGDYIVWRLNRIAAAGTAPAADPFCLGVGFHAQKDTLGSRTETIK